MTELLMHTVNALLITIVGRMKSRLYNLLPVASSG